MFAVRPGNVFWKPSFHYSGHCNRKCRFFRQILKIFCCLGDILGQETERGEKISQTNDLGYSGTGAFSCARSNLLQVRVLFADPPLTLRLNTHLDRDSEGALLVYDITDRESFTKVRNWVKVISKYFLSQARIMLFGFLREKELRKIVGPKIVLVIAGNKMDLVKNRQVDEEEAVEYAKSVGAVHMPCSAKTGKGVEEAFLELTKGVLKMKGGKPTAAGEYQGKSRNFVQITEENVVPAKKSGGCC